MPLKLVSNAHPKRCARPPDRNRRPPRPQFRNPASHKSLRRRVFLAMTSHPTGLRLYDYAASANCYKVRLLLAQLRQPYERVPIDIFAGDTLTDDFQAKNPARSTPVLQIGESTYLTESNAILFFLAEGTPFLPDDPLQRAEV